MDFTGYYDEIYRNCKPLSKEAEVELLNVFFNSDASPAVKKQARDRLITSNMRYVFNRARRRAKGNIEQLEELIAAGNDGLIKGFDKYDPTSGVKLLTYSGWWVMQRQLKEMSDWRLVKLPIQKQQMATKIKRYIDSVEGTPSIESLREAFPDISERDLRELSQTQYLTFYLDDMLESDSPEVSPMEQLAEDDEFETINEIIARYPYPDCHIARLAFGLVDEVEYKTPEIVKTINESYVDANYVKQVKKRVLAKLQQELAS